MTRRALLSCLGVLLALPALAFGAGGWVITTVDDLPEYLVAGQPTEITFTMRAHGITPINDMKPTIDAASGSMATPTVQASRGKGTGRYTAQVVVPKPGQWTLTINTNFGRIKSVLLPIRAIASDAARPAAMPDVDRGAQLFVAKGCVGCHVNGNVDRRTLVTIGPELTDRRYPPAYLAKLLADPASVRGIRQGPRMPNLELRDAEIRALVAFINAEPAPTQR